MPDNPNKPDDSTSSAPAGGAPASTAPREETQQSEQASQPVSVVIPAAHFTVKPRIVTPQG